MSYYIKLLNKQHNRKDFDCGVEPLNVYLKNRSGQDQKKHIAVTYVMHDLESDHIAGYCTLSSTSIELKALPDVVKRSFLSIQWYPLH